MMLIAALTTACGSNTPAALAAHYTWGQTYRDTVNISVGAPVAFTTSRQNATPREVPAWQTVLVLVNAGPDPFPLTNLRVGATSQGVPQQEVIDPYDGCNGIEAQSPLMPGQTIALDGCWTGQNTPRSVTFTLLDSLRSVTFSDPDVRG